MKDLLSKEHYSYEIDTLLMKSSASLPYMDNPPTNNGGGSHYGMIRHLSASFIFQHTTRIAQRITG